MSRQTMVLLSLLGIVLLAGLGLLARQKLHREQETVMTPARGAAAYNPLFVLEHSLRGSGLQARSQRYLAGLAEQLEAGDTLLLVTDSRQLSAPQADSLAAFVQRGGHLVLASPAPTPGGRRPQSGTLLPLLGLQARPRCEEQCDLRVAITAPARVVFKRPGHARLQLGSGHVDVLDRLHFLYTGRVNAAVSEPGSGRYLANGLANPEHQRQAQALLAPNWGKGTVHLVFGQRNDRWWSLALRHGVMAWLPLALLLAGWLWARSQRRGPLLPSPPMARRSLREHVAASAAHLLRNQRGLVLYDHALGALQRRLALRAPALAGLHGAALENALAVRTGQDVQKVALALRRPARNDKAALHQRTTLLMELRNLL